MGSWVGGLTARDDHVGVWGIGFCGNGENLVKRPRVLIADAHVLIAQGLAKILEKKYEAVGIVTNGKALLKSLERSNPDLVLVDLSLPMMNGLEAARRIMKRYPRTKVVFVTLHNDPPFVKEALLLGVSGYFLKHTSVAELMKGLQEVMQGGTYFSPRVHPAMPIGSRSAVQRKRRFKAQSPLTPRQGDILQLAAEGFSNKGIAKILSVSLKTVEFHKANLKKRLGVQTTAGLTKYALKRKLIGP